MLRKIKPNVILILSFLILLTVLCYKTYMFIDHRNFIIAKNEESRQFCLKSDYINTDHENYCKMVLSTPDYKVDFFTMATDLLVFGYGKLSLVLYLFVIIPALLYICKYFRSKMIVNGITRTDFKTIKRSLFKDAYKSVLIWPVIVIIAFGICWFYTKSFDPSYALINSSTRWTQYTLNHPILFISLYLLNVIIHSILYVNISLCIARKYHHYFASVILSFLIFIGIESFLEIVINGLIFISLFKSDMGIIFNIMNMLSFNDTWGPFMVLLIPLILTIISFIVLNILYSNKENLIIDCEKNE